MTALLAWLLDPAIRYVFLEKQRAMVLLIPATIVAAVTLRAALNFGETALTNLVGLGPIKAIRWTTRLGGLDGKVNAERWTVAGLDFLELSIRVEAGIDSEPVQQAFEQAVRSLGLAFQEIQQPKTQVVLEALASRHR